MEAEAECSSVHTAAWLWRGFGSPVSGDVSLHQGLVGSCLEYSCLGLGIEPRNFIFNQPLAAGAVQPG